MRQDVKFNNKTNDKVEEDDDEDDNERRSWDSLDDDDDDDEVLEEGQDDDDDDDDDDEDDGKEDDNEGIDDEAAKKYKPYRNRNLLSPITKMEARIHLLNSSLGLGIILLPEALNKFGLFYGSVGVVLISAISTHCLHILIKAMYRMYCRRHTPHLDYSECIGYAIEENYGLSPKFTPVIVWFIASLMFLCQLNIAAIYVKYIGQTARESLGEFWAGFNISESVIKSILAIPLILVNSLPTIKDLVYGSMIGILSAFVAIGLIIKDISPYLSSGQVEFYIRMSEFPYFVGVVMFSTYSLGVVLLLEGNMKKPKILIGTKGILNQMMLIVILIYLIVGFLSVTILHGTMRPKRNIIDQIKFPTRFARDAKFFLILVCFFSHPLVCYEIFEVVWNSRVKKYIEESLNMRRRVINYLVRVVVVLITVGLAYPHLHNISTLVSLCGTLLIPIVGIILPSFLHILTSKPHSHWITLKDILVLSFGFSVFIAGIYMSITMLEN